MIKIETPATTANMGPGFDCMGMALSLHNILCVEEADSGLLIENRSNQDVPLDERNMIYLTIKNFYNEIGKKMPGLHMIQDDHIPMTRGLGSSAACVVSGLAAANELSGAGLGCGELLQMAARLEGHPDNAAPAFLGGIVVGAMENGRLHSCKLDAPRLGELAFAAMIPGFPLATEYARAVLPGSYSRADAVFNASRAALLTAALTSGRFELLGEAMRDVLHQPYRAKIIPGMGEIFAGCMGNGALGVFLSGAGPTAIAVVPREGAPGFRPPLPAGWGMRFIEPDNGGVKITRGASIERIG